MALISADSQSPTPTPRKSINVPQTERQAQGQQPDTPHGNCTDCVVIESETETDQQATGPQKGRTPNRDKSPLDAWYGPDGTIALLTIVLAGLALAQLLSYLRSLKHTRVIERAYIDITDWRFKNSDDAPPSLVWSIKNGGHTPAYHVCIAMDWRLNREFPADAVYKRPPTDAATFMVNGGSQHAASAPAPTLDRQRFDAFSQGQARLFLWGQIRYRDVFGATHHRRYAICAERGGAQWYATDNMKNDEDLG